MGLTAYVGLTLGFWFLHVWATVGKRNGGEDQDRALQWWFATTGLVWLVSLSYLYLLEREVSGKRCFSWGIMTGGLAFMIGAPWLIIGGDGNDTFWRWFLLNLVCFIPLVFIGAATGVVFIMFLGAVGFLVDSWRFAMFVGDLLSGAASAPIQFLVFSLTGLAVGAVGYVLNAYQERVEAWATEVVRDAQDRLCRRREPGPGGNTVDPLRLFEPINEEPVNDEPLLDPAVSLD